MRKKQIVCLTLAAALLGLTACGNAQSAGTAASTEKAKTEGTDGTKSTETTEAGKDGDSSEPVTLTYWVPFGSSAAKYVTGDNDNVAYQEAMKRLGINIEFIHPAIRNAVLNATGVAVDSLPLDPQKLVAHFKAAELI